MDNTFWREAGAGQDDAVRLEIPARVLKRLLAEGHLGAADLRCLDCTSRACLRRLCLQSCVRTQGPERCVAGQGRLRSVLSGS